MDVLGERREPEWGEFEAKAVRNLSPTKVEAYLKDPIGFKFRYVDKIPEMSSGFLVSGRVVHSVLEHAMKRVMAGFGLPPEKDMDDLFLEEWARAVKEESEKANHIGWDWEPSETQIKEECRALLPFAREDVLPKLKPKLVEEDAKIYYPSEVGEFLVWGKLDLMEENGVVSDWKTTAGNVSKNARESWLQFSHYSKHAHEVLGGDSVTKCRKIFLIRGKKPNVDVEWYQITPEKRKWFEDAAAQVWKGIHYGVYPPNTNGWHCSPKYCSFYGACYGEVIS